MRSFVIFLIPVLAFSINSFVVYYGLDHLEKLEKFDLAIISQNTLTPDALEKLKDSGTIPVVYMSLGEIAPYDMAIYEIPKEDIAGVNEVWGSYIIKATSGVWRNIVMRRIRDQMDRGFEGVFMDTVWGNPAGNEAMADFIREIRENFPDIVLVQNGAFDLLELTKGYVDYVLWESFATTFDFASGKYKKRHIDEDLVEKVKKIAEEAKIGVLALSYAEPWNEDLIEYAKRRSREYGFVPYVTSIYLERIYDDETLEAFKVTDFDPNNVVPLDVGGIGDTDPDYPSYVVGDWSEPVIEGGYTYRVSGTGWDSFVVLTIHEPTPTRIFFVYKDEPAGLPAGYVAIVHGSFPAGIASQRYFLKGVSYDMSGDFRIDHVDVYPVDIEDVDPTKEGIQIALMFRGVKLAQVGNEIDIELSKRIVERPKVEETPEIPKKECATITINRTETPPVIDGIVDEPWKGGFIAHLSGEDIGYRPGDWKGPGDLSADVYALWDDDALYLLFDVTDDRIEQRTKGWNMWKGDHVEVWIDTNLVRDWKVHTPNSDDYQIGLSPGNFSDFGPEAYIWVPDTEGAWREIEVSSEKTEKGYVLESAIPWRILGIEPKEGFVFGLVLTVSDTDSEEPEQETMISTCKESPSHWGDTRYFNNAVLK